MITKRKTHNVSITCRKVESAGIISAYGETVTVSFDSLVLNGVEWKVRADFDLVDTIEAARIESPIKQTYSHIKRSDWLTNNKTYRQNEPTHEQYKAIGKLLYDKVLEWINATPEALVEGEIDKVKDEIDQVDREITDIVHKVAELQTERKALVAKLADLDPTPTGPSVGIAN